MSTGNREEIIEKIKKCLALSSSSNEHEAAAALRQARKLMDLHGITSIEVEISDVNESRHASGAKKSPSLWESALASLVARAFGVQSIFSRNWDGGYWVFVGIQPSNELAKYAFVVLHRQIKRARAGHIKTKLNRCKTATKTRRADLFCEGWVIGAARIVGSFSRNERHEEMIEKYISQTWGGNLKELSPINRNEGKGFGDRDRRDYHAGVQSGKDAQLNHGVSGTSPGMLEMKS